MRSGITSTCTTCPTWRRWTSAVGPAVRWWSSSGLGATWRHWPRGLLRWAATLDEVTASIWRVPDGGSVHLSITGRMPCGVPVDVYGGVHFDEAVFPDLPAGARQDMPVFVLHSVGTA